MAEIKFTIKDTDDGESIEVKREVISNEPKDKTTVAKQVAVAFSYCLDNPYMVSNILSVAAAERQVDKVEVTGEELKDGEVRSDN